PATATRAADRPHGSALGTGHDVVRITPAPRLAAAATRRDAPHLRRSGARRAVLGSSGRSLWWGRMTAPESYDHFAPGRFPVGVRTVHADDAARGLRFPVEVWYPAVAAHAGQDLAPSTQDAFVVAGVSRRQRAVRDAVAERGRHPLIVHSHLS